MPTTYVEAIREGLWEEMERDPNVFMLGEDIFHPFQSFDKSFRHSHGRLISKQVILASFHSPVVEESSNCGGVSCGNPTLPKLANENLQGI